MIRFDSVTARVRGVAVLGVTFTHERGALAIVGAPSDGAGAILELAAGLAKSSRGRIGRPADEAIAHVPLEPMIVEGLRVRELLSLAAEVRGESDRAAERLRAFDLESLAERETRTLSIAEARSVLICEALTSTKTKLVSIEEPLARVMPSVSMASRRMIREHPGAVLVSTSSPEDARALAETFAIVRGGRLVAVCGALDPLTVIGPRGVRMTATVSDPHALAAALAAGGIARMHIDERSVTAFGEDPTALARAMQRAMLGKTFAVESLRLEPLALASVQATAEANAAYQAALMRTRQAVPMPAPGPSPEKLPS